MDETQPTQPLPEPEGPQASGGGSVPPAGAVPPADGVPPAGAVPPPPPGAVPPSAGAPLPPEPFYRRHGLAFAISTLVLAIVVVIGGAAVGVFAVASVIANVGLHHSISRVIPGPNAGPPRQQPREQGIVRGTISEIGDSSWKVETPGGQTVTVKIDSSTRFGFSGRSESASDFAKGDTVLVLGKRSGDTVTASRILKADELPIRPPSRPGSTATPGAGTP